jgi:hypothetical protein
MNYPGSYSNMDEFASATCPDPLWAFGNYQYDPYLSVPQSTYPGPVSDPAYHSTAGTFVPDFHAVDEAAFSLTPTAEMGSFALPIQGDFSSQVRNQMCLNVDMD